MQHNLFFYWNPIWYIPFHNRKDTAMNNGCIIRQGHTMNKEWITDRRPIEHDESYVYDSFGHVCHRIKIANGQPWKPIPKCEPYVKPKQWKAAWDNNRRIWTLRNTAYNYAEVQTCDIGIVCLEYLSEQDKHREAAERIAAIYEEVMP